MHEVSSRIGICQRSFGAGGQLADGLPVARNRLAQAIRRDSCEMAPPCGRMRHFARIAEGLVVFARRD